MQQSTGAHLNAAELARAGQDSANAPPTWVARFAEDGVRHKAAGDLPVYRFFNTWTNAHFYTASAAEREQVRQRLPQFRDEGQAFVARASPSAALSPVTRFFNRQTGVHFYTISQDERAHVLAHLPQFVDEGVAYYASQVSAPGFKPLYRFYVTTLGIHFYTGRADEAANIRASLPHYRDEGVGYHVVGEPDPPVSSNPFDALYPAGFRLRTLAADAIPAVAQPAGKASNLAVPSYTDPTYNTRVYRATQATDFPGATRVRHDYSRRQAFNADNSRYLASSSNGYWLLYDGARFQRLSRQGHNGALKGLAGDAEPIWHPTDPTRLWYTSQNGGLVWWEKNVETDTDTVMVNFTGRLPWPGATSVWTRAEGTASADGRYFAFMATSYNSTTGQSVIHGLICYDRLSNTFTTLNASAFGNAFPDHVSMSPSGRYVVPSWDGALGTRAYTRDFSSSRQLHVKSEHSDLALDDQGQDQYVLADYTAGKLRSVRLSDGASTDLLDIYTAGSASTSLHVSGQAFGRPGWVLVSTYADSASNGSVRPDPVTKPGHRKLMLLEIRAGGQQLAVAHTRLANNYGDGSGNYFGEPHATISRDGTRVLFASNFNTGGVASSYLVGLPGSVYE